MPVVPFRFACTRCGHCCSGGTGHVWVEPHELEPLARALGMSPARFAERHLRRVDGRLSLREEPGGRCALLAGANTCTVYGARPQHCRSFPFWESVLAEREAFEAARATCPGIAVEVGSELRARAAGELRALYASIAERSTSACCLERAPQELFATGMEADHALEARATPDPAAPGCKLGAGRPLACRMARAGLAPKAAEALQQWLREIERRISYPASYARIEDLLRSRGGSEDAGSTSCGQLPQPTS